MEERQTAGLVSVVMPCYNAAAYLQAAIESVLSQSYRRLELIVVNDGSTDASGAVARAFGSQIVLLEQDNLGAAAARNAGLPQARGEYIAFCDADDLWPADKLGVQLHALQEHPDCDYVLGLVHNFLSPDLEQDQARRLSFPTEPMSGRLLGAVIVRRTAFFRVGLFDPSCQSGEALDWFARAADLGLRAHTVPEVVLRRRVHGANTTLRPQLAASEYLRVLKAALDRRRLQAETTSGVGKTG